MCKNVLFFSDSAVAWLNIHAQLKDTSFSGWRPEIFTQTYPEVENGILHWYDLLTVRNFIRVILQI